MIDGTTIRVDDPGVTGLTLRGAVGQTASLLRLVGDYSLAGCGISWDDGDTGIYESAVDRLTARADGVDVADFNSGSVSLAVPLNVATGTANTWGIRCDSNGANYSGVFFDAVDNGMLLARDSAGNIDVRLEAGAGPVLYKDNTGLGVGTDSPAETLHVDGTMRFESATNGNTLDWDDIDATYVRCTLSGGLQYLGNHATKAPLLVSNANISTRKALDADGLIECPGLIAASQATVPTNVTLGYVTASHYYVQSWSSLPLTLNPLGNNVGIGTTSPGVLLDVEETSAGTHGRIRIGHTDNTSAVSHTSLFIESGGTSGGDAFLGFGVSGSTHWSMGIDNSDTDKFKIVKSAGFGSSEFFAIDISGNVGIGTTSPAALIHGLATTEQLRLGYDASNYTSFTTNSGGNLNVDPSGGTANIYDGSTNFQFRVYNGATVGVQLKGTGTNYFRDGAYFGGSSAPSEDVHAADTVRADTRFNLNGTDGGNGTVVWTDGSFVQHTVVLKGGIVTSWKKDTTEQLT